LCFFQPAFLMMYSAYKLNKQGDNIHPWRTPFPIWISWEYKLKRQITLCLQTSSITPWIIPVSSPSFPGLPRWHSGKESACHCRRHRFDLWVEKTPGEGTGNALQYSCLGNPMDRRRLVGCSLWCLKESDMTEHACTHSFLTCKLPLQLRN